jgi:hypothetical protein
MKSKPRRNTVDKQLRGRNKKPRGRGKGSKRDRRRGKSRRGHFRGPMGVKTVEQGPLLGVGQGACLSRVSRRTQPNNLPNKLPLRSDGKRMRRRSGEVRDRVGERRKKVARDEELDVRWGSKKRKGRKGARDRRQKKGGEIGYRSEGWGRRVVGRKAGSLSPEGKEDSVGVHFEAKPQSKNPGLRRSLSQGGVSEKSERSKERRRRAGPLPQQGRGFGSKGPKRSTGGEVKGKRLMGEVKSDLRGEGVLRGVGRQWGYCGGPNHAKGKSAERREGRVQWRLAEEGQWPWEDGEADARPDGGFSFGNNQSVSPVAILGSIATIAQAGVEQDLSSRGGRERRAKEQMGVKKEAKKEVEGRRRGLMREESIGSESPREMKKREVVGGRRRKMERKRRERAIAPIVGDFA